MGNFGDVYNLSLKEYKKNFKSYFWILLLLSIIPSFLLNIFVLQINEYSFETNNIYIVSFLFSVLVMFLGFLAQLSMIYLSLNLGKKVNSGKAISSSGKYLLRYLFLLILGFLVVFGGVIVLIGLSLVFYWNNILFSLALFVCVIFSIIFIFYIILSWIFSTFIIVDENKGTIGSIKKSVSLVKNRRWSVFGYMVLFWLIVLGMGILIFVPSGILNYSISEPYVIEVMQEDYFGEMILVKTYPYNIQLITLLINTLAGAIFSLIYVPLGVLFLKNLYLEFKKKKR